MPQVQSGHGRQTGAAPANALSHAHLLDSSDVVVSRQLHLRDVAEHCLVRRTGEDAPEVQEVVVAGGAAQDEGKGLACLWDVRRETALVLNRVGVGQSSRGLGSPRS